MLYDEVRPHGEHITAFFMDAAELNADGQRELIKKISPFCAEEEIKSILIGIAYFRQLHTKTEKKLKPPRLREAGKDGGNPCREKEVLY